MNHTTFPTKQRDASILGTLYIAAPRFYLHISSMALTNIFCALQLIGAAALLHESNTSQLTGYGVLGVLTGSALGMLIATSSKNRMSWRIWGRRFAAYFLSGIIVTAGLITITAHLGVEPSTFLAFACGGFGGFAGLGLVLMAEKRAKKEVSIYLEEDESEGIAPVPPGRVIDLRTNKTETHKLI